MQISVLLYVCLVLTEIVIAGKEKCLGMMTAMVVLAFMLVTCLQGQDHVILRTCLTDMGGNQLFLLC